MGVRSDRGWLFIDFRWKGIRCREYPGLRDTPENRKQLTPFWDLVRAEIRNGTFDYKVRFPDGGNLHLFYPAEAAAAPTPTVAEYLERWLASRSPFRPDGTLIDRHQIRPTTWYHDCNAVRGQLIPALGHHRIDELTRGTIREWRRRILETGGRTSRGLSVKTVHNLLGLLRKAFNDAVEDGLLETNPVPRTTRNERRSVIYRTNCDPLTAEEAARFLEAVPARYADLYRLWFATGMRPSEIVALRWVDIDWNRSAIMVRNGRTPRMGGVEAIAKTGHRLIDLKHDPDAMAALRAQQKRQLAAGLAASPYVFATSKGTPFSQEELNREVWHPTLKRIGLHARGEYAIKDTYCTLALSAGEDPGWVKNQVGVTEATLWRNYRKWIPTPARRDGSLVANALRRARGQMDGQIGTRGRKIRSRIKASPTGFEPLRHVARGASAVAISRVSRAR